jgi:hypothetical protein
MNGMGLKREAKAVGATIVLMALIIVFAGVIGFVLAIVSGLIGWLIGSEEVGTYMPLVIVFIILYVAVRTDLRDD